MRPAEIESWVYQVLNRVRSQAPGEDDLVELKRDLGDPVKRARRLAALANAAAFEPILWLVGVDEKSHDAVGAIGDVGDWWQRVAAQFDEQAPRPQFHNMTIDGKPVLAAVFGTEAAPFVVKNPTGGTIQREVPWREGTNTRTARRSDLVRLLVPAAVRPHVEVLRGHLDIPKNNQPEEAFIWHLKLYGYLELPIGSQLIVPDHRCSGRLEVGAEFDVPLEDVRMTTEVGSAVVLPRMAGWSAATMREPVVTIERGDAQLLVHGSGHVVLEGKYRSERVLPTVAGLPISVHVAFCAVGGAGPVTVSSVLHPASPGDDQVAWWQKPAKM